MKRKPKWKASMTAKEFRKVSAGMEELEPEIGNLVLHFVLGWLDDGRDKSKATARMRGAIARIAALLKLANQNEGNQ